MDPQRFRNCTCNSVNKEHAPNCPKRQSECRYKPMGCNFSGPFDTLGEHEVRFVAKHLELVTIYCATLENNSKKDHDKIQNLGAIVTTFELKLTESAKKIIELNKFVDEKLRIFESQLSNSASTSSLNVAKRSENYQTTLPSMETDTVSGISDPEVKDALEKIPIIQRAIANQSERSFQITADNQNLSTRVKKIEKEIPGKLRRVQDQLNEVDKQTGLHDVRISELDIQCQMLATTSYDGQLVWKISNYKRRKMEALSGRTSIYSPPFYTSRGTGYKLGCRAYLNGDGLGLGSHLSLFFLILKGEFDSLVIWPFRYKVTFELLDQSGDGKHLCDSFMPDENTTSFKQPTNETNVATGIPTFISHQRLESSNKYLKDDTIFLRCTIHMKGVENESQINIRTNQPLDKPRKDPMLQEQDLFGLDKHFIMENFLKIANFNVQEVSAMAVDPPIPQAVYNIS